MALVLLIDDDVSLHSLLGKFLEQQHTVIHAQDGREGLRVFFEQRPDIVVLDVMMPYLDGWGTLDRIREMSRIPVILLTAKDAEQDKLRGFQLRSDDYVTKPFSFAELAARIEAVLRRNSGEESSSEILRLGDLVLELGAAPANARRHANSAHSHGVQVTPNAYAPAGARFHSGTTCRGGVGRGIC